MASVPAGAAEPLPVSASTPAGEWQDGAAQAAHGPVDALLALAQAAIESLEGSLSDCDEPPFLYHCPPMDDSVPPHVYDDCLCGSS